MAANSVNDGRALNPPVQSPPKAQAPAPPPRHPEDPYHDLHEVFTETSMSPLSVHVDFNDLLNDFGESEAVRLIGMLKDLLR